MKTKRFIAAILSAVLAATAVVSASAATLNDVAPENSIPVTAKIVDPGSVSYVITIPDKADFGTLTQPESDVDSYVFTTGLQVEATKLNIQNNQAVSVYAKNSTATSEDNKFYITQQGTDTPQKFEYSFYYADVTEENIAASGQYLVNTSEVPNTHGYHLYTFRKAAAGTAEPMTLVFNQKALYGKTLSEIAGDYSGTISFFSALVQLS